MMRRIAAADEQFKPRRYDKGSESRSRPRVRRARRAQPRDTDAAGRHGRRRESDTGLGSTGRDSGGRPGRHARERARTVAPSHGPTTRTISRPPGASRNCACDFAVDPMRGSDDMSKDPIVERAIDDGRREDRSSNPSGAVASGGCRAAPAGGTPRLRVSRSPSRRSRRSARLPAAAPPPGSGDGGAPCGVPRRRSTRSIKEKKDEPNHAFWGGHFHSVPGDGFYAFQLYVTGRQGPGGAPRSSAES